MNLRHGESVRVEPITENRKESSLASITLELSNLPNESPLQLAQLSQIEANYSLSQLFHLHFDSSFQNHGSSLLLPVVGTWLRGVVVSSEPSEGTVTSETSVSFVAKPPVSAETFIQPTPLVTRTLNALQFSLSHEASDTPFVHIRGLLVVGGAGSGKSSVLHYFCDKLNASFQENTCLVVSAADFAYSDPFHILETSPHLRVLCIDDMDDLSEGWVHRCSFMQTSAASFALFQSRNHSHSRRPLRRVGPRVPAKRWFVFSSSSSAEAFNATLVQNSPSQEDRVIILVSF